MKIDLTKHKVHPTLVTKVREYIEAQKTAQEALKEATKWRHLIEKEIAELLGIPGKYIVIGHWDCPKSPIGLCVYRNDEECLVCGEPCDRS